MTRALIIAAIGLALAGCPYREERKPFTSKNLWEAIDREQRAALHERETP